MYRRAGPEVLAEEGRSEDWKQQNSKEIPEYVIILTIGLEIILSLIVQKPEKKKIKR